MNKSTIFYYNNQAQSYADSTVNLDVSDLHQRFVQNIQPGRAILDGGCGSGRDALAFKQMGFKVEAFDASEGLAAIASNTIGQAVYKAAFADINPFDFDVKFDGIWCMASLLHLTDTELADALKKLASVANRHATFFASFKTGEGQSYDDKGRFFNYQTQQKLTRIFNSTGLFKDLELSFNVDKMGREDTNWISVFAKIV